MTITVSRELAVPMWANYQLREHALTSMPVHCLQSVSRFYYDHLSLPTIYIPSPSTPSTCAAFFDVFMPQLDAWLIFHCAMVNFCNCLDAVALQQSRNALHQHDFRIRLASVLLEVLGLFFHCIAMSSPQSVLFLICERILLVCHLLLSPFRGNLVTKRHRDAYAPVSHPSLFMQPSLGHHEFNESIHIGGRTSHPFTYKTLEHYILQRDSNQLDITNNIFHYVDHIDEIYLSKYPDSQFLHTRLPFADFIEHLPVPTLRKINRIHNCSASSHATRPLLIEAILAHSCPKCNAFVTVFSIDSPRLKSTSRVKRHRAKKLCDETSIHKDQNPHVETPNNIENTFDDSEVYPFPPEPLSELLSHNIVYDACQKMSIPNIEEAGCAVCGELKPVAQLSPLKHIKNYLHVLKTQGVTCIARSSLKIKKKEYSGPVLDYKCKSVCSACRASLRQAKVPRLALAKGMWLGEIPEELSNLRFVERMLVARVRHTCCYVKIATGGRKMKANVIAFETPMPKIYSHLPPPRAEMDDVLAIFFTGPCMPTESDFKRGLVLVRRNAVARALEWLKMNHKDYEDIEISHENLAEYGEHEPPCSVEYRPLDTNKAAEGTSVHDLDDEDGVENGDCPFVVHGLTGEKLETMTTSKLKALALKHLNSQGKFLVVGHEDKPESIWDNPHLYPKMFPWLFPYGLGGIGTTELSDKEHKRHLLMYHDKRFQTDPTFPFVAFSHEQVKASTTQSFLLAEKTKFDNIASRLLALDQLALNGLIEKLSTGEHASPESDEEKACYQVIRDLDHIGGRIRGSTTSKKYMRNEIWSLVAHCGAPSWYITLSPADTKHPICLYYAGTNTKYEPALQDESERIRQICRNPVASARFFHFLVQVFIDVVLGVKSDHRGLYGDTQAYYGTVEQQGRLALHLHLLLWIKGSLRPQEVRERIMAPDSAFQKRLIMWLESCVAGEFFTGTQEEVTTKAAQNAQAPDYVNPTESMPIPPPPRCDDHQSHSALCMICTKAKEWWNYFLVTVDDILIKSNIHSCTRNKNKDGGNNKKHVYVGCMDNKWGKCKARFPRPTFQETIVNKDTGSIDMKKKEPWLNTFTAIITYLFRCNTDVTSLLSGTAIKAVILYVSDYITKAPLKTHVIFEAIRSIFTKNTELICGTLPGREKARRLISKIANLLSTKLEMGAPMISMYLLGNPDHYTDHKFVPFYWKSYVTEARKFWHESEETFEHDKVALVKHKGEVIGLSPIFDYIFRSPELEEMNLHDWIRRCVRKKTSKKKSKECQEEQVEEAFDDENDVQGDFVHIKSRKSKFSTHQFTKSHPLHETHHAQLAPDDAKIVPNFIGASLPRMDQGDREYYCSTMLTLFKPWRSGQDLKAADENWNTSFLNHTFTTRQHEIMKNMNIRYECLDSRDDYRAQLKKNSGILPVWAETQFDAEAETVDGTDCYALVNYDIDDDGMPLHLLNLGKAEMRRLRETLTMRNIMNNIGWTKEICKGDLHGVHDIDPSAISRTLSGAEWKAEVNKKRQEVIEAQKHHIPAEKTLGSIASSSHASANIVKIADKSYLVKSMHRPEYQGIINNIVMQFSLNEEQERAFRIVANHASDSYAEPLRMYLAGMAGTGKSQVLKSLIQYFKCRDEGYRLMIVAPTGNAAALLGGSTYHSSLGINDYNEKNALNLSQVRARLIGVDYIFLDEVSMLSCHDMYRISCQLALALNNADQPFGAMSMLFAGDFAQLPPVIGGENSALYSRKIGAIASHQRSQEEAMGKALWHQVTTVVILRKNMRQQQQTEDDNRLRTALENMRYKACTAADIAFLQTRISSSIPGHVSVCDDEFRNVPIIIGLNVHKDEVNRLGTERFAAETGQELTHFYSDDFPKQASGKNKGSTNKVRHISDELQKVLWNQTPSTCDKHIPGKLSLCKGIPVMIRSNAATELCITKGQEATVYGWQSAKGSRGQLILDTLFVKLINPPSNVQIEGLPENVIPLSKTTTLVCCTLPDDTKIYVQRNQVEVLPNFALTDYASQGKTRPYNPADLNNCRTHQAYYTVLSRSASAAGTLIIQGFHPQKVMGGASGALRQEFRELELLNEITAMRYEGRLDKNVVGNQRNMLIAAFRKRKGLHYVPQTVHRAIRWNSKDPLLEPEIEDIKWRIIERQKHKNTIGKALSGPSNSENQKDKSNNENPSSKPSISENQKDKNNQENLSSGPPISESQKYKNNTEKPSSVTSVHEKQNLSNSEPIPSLKRKRCKSDTKSKQHKKGKFSTNIVTQKSIQIANPVGLRWSNNSCAYDAVFSILYSLWRDEPDHWSSVLCNINPTFFPSICSGFQDYHEGISTLESVRDDFRHAVHDSNIDHLSWGIYTSVNRVMLTLFTTPKEIFSSQLACDNNHVVRRQMYSRNESYMLHAGTNTYTSISNWIQGITEPSERQCGICNRHLTRRFHFPTCPKVLLFDISKNEMNIDSQIHITGDHQSVTLYLRGIIYYGNFHFTSRIIVNNQVWFHDGVTTGMEMIYEGGLQHIENWFTTRGQQAEIVVYAEKVKD
jgi:hypothetical protein